MFVCNALRIGEYRNQKALPFQHCVYFTEVPAQKRLAARDQAPQGAQGHGFISDAGDFIRPQFQISGVRVIRRKPDIAVAAVARAAGGQLQFE